MDFCYVAKLLGNLLIGPASAITEYGIMSFCCADRFLGSLLTGPASAMTEYGIMSFETLPRQPCLLNVTVYTWANVNDTVIEVTCALDKGQVSIAPVY